MTSSARKRRLALALIILLGTSVRLFLYAYNPSLTEDEVSVSLNIAMRGYAELLKELELHQTAAVGFLWVERLSISLFGVNEYSPRLFPMLCGLASLPVMWFAVRTFLDEWAALLATLVVAIAPAAVLHSNEVKPYAGDLLVTAALLWLAGSRRSVALWVPAGATAILFSTPSIFVLAGIWVHQAAAAAKRIEGRRFWFGWCAAGLCWAAAFLALYFTLYAPQANSDYMIRFWRPAFFGSQPDLVSAAKVVIRGVLDPGFALDGRATLLIWAPGLLFGLGLIRAPFLAGAPLAAAITASLFNKWIFAERLMLFYLPIAALAIAAGAGLIVSVLRRRKLGWAALTAVVAAFPLKATSYVVRHPVRQDLRGAVRFAEARFSQTGAIYFYWSHPAWLFYTIDWKAPDAERLGWYRRLFQAFGTITGNARGSAQNPSHALALLAGPRLGDRRS